MLKAKANFSLKQCHKNMLSGCILVAPLFYFFDLSVRWSWLVSFVLMPFTTKESVSCAYWIVGWIGPRVGLDAVENGKTLHCWELGCQKKQLKFSFFVLIFQIQNKRRYCICFMQCHFRHLCPRLLTRNVRIRYRLFRTFSFTSGISYKFIN
jgi:hypothetical protein